MVAALVINGGGAVFAHVSLGRSSRRFYKGKNLSMVISSSAAAATTPCRAPSHATWRGTSPANRNIVPRNMPGAGGIVANKFLSFNRPTRWNRDGRIAEQRPARTALRHQGKRLRSHEDELARHDRPSRRACCSSGTRRRFKTIEDVKHREMTAGASGSIRGRRSIRAS